MINIAEVTQPQVKAILSNLGKENNYLYQKPVWEWDKYDKSNFQSILRKYYRKKTMEEGGLIGELSELREALEVAESDNEREIYQEAIAELEARIAADSNQVTLEPEAVITTNEQLQSEEKQYSKTWLSNSEFFKLHPEKILGNINVSRDRWGKDIEEVTGTIDNLNKIDTASNFDADMVDGSDDIGTSVISETLEQEMAKPEIEQKVKDVIEKDNKDIGRKIIRKKKKREAIESDEPVKAELQTYTEIFDSEINKNVSLEELRAFLWYKNRIGQQLSLEWYMMAYDGLDYIPAVSQGEVDKWVKDGLLFYYDGQEIPAYLYLSGNVYEKIQKLVPIGEGFNAGKDKEPIIERYGQSVYDNQVKALNEVYQKQYANRLILKGEGVEDGLIILPISDFAKTFKIDSFADGVEIKWVVAKDKDNFGKPNFLKIDGKERDMQVFTNISLTDAFCVWLVKNRNSIQYKKKTNYVEIIYYYIQGRFKQAPSGLGDLEKKAWKAEQTRIKARAKDEADRLFLKFLFDELSLNDKVAIETAWNTSYNSYVPVDYSKVPVAFNLAKEYRGEALDIRPEKREAVAFLFNEGCGGLAYDVGVGKTISAIFTIEQFLVAGYCKRPFVVVPNQTYKQWLTEIKGVLPHRKINDLYNLRKDYYEELLDENGQVMPIDDGSISVITYEGFESIGFNEQTEGLLLRELANITDAGDDKSDKQKEAQYQKLLGIVGKAMRGTHISIEQLGFDFMCVDEAHAMKKVFTKVQGEESKEDEKFVNAAKGKYNKNQYKFTSGEQSSIALKGFCISQYIQKNNNGRNVVLLTATPFTNSPLEIFSMMALIAYKHLQETDLNNIINFFDNYTHTTTELVINIKLQPQYRQIIKGFNNLVSLQSLVRRFWNYKTGEDVGVIRPDKYVIPYTKKIVDGLTIRLDENEKIESYIPLSNEQSIYMDAIKSYAQSGTTPLSLLSKNAPETAPITADDFVDEDEMTSDADEVDESSMTSKEKAGVLLLKAANMARNLALSPYLYKEAGLGVPTYKEYVETSPKIQYVMECIRSVKAYHEAHNEPVSGQVIYMDRGLAYFNLLKEYLVHEVGFQPHEIGLIYSGMAKPKENKENIKNLFNGDRYNPETKKIEPVSDAERIKVIIGSSTIKEGINLQKKATVLYNCFMDWNPTDLQQLTGRIWRQQNEFLNVRIVNPLMIDSIDIFMFQKLEEKTERINSIWSSNGKNVLSLDELNPMEIKSSLIKDPFILAGMLLEDEKAALEDSKASLDANINRVNGINDAIKTLDLWNRELTIWIQDYRPSRKDFSNKDALIKELISILKKPTDENGLPIVEEWDRIKYVNKKLPVSDRTDVPSKPRWFDRVVSANRILQKEIKDFLKPRGYEVKELDLLVEDLEKQKVVIDEQIKLLGSEEVVNQKAQEIIEERERNKITFKSIPELVADFGKLNCLLSLKRNKVEIDKFEPETACQLLDEEGMPRIDDEAIEHLTKCVQALPQTKDLWVDETGEYVESRKQLHEKIINDVKSKADCIIQEQPIAILTGGSPASGKSTFLGTYAKYLSEGKIFKIDADEIRAKLPEYKGWNSYNTQLEQKDIVQRLLSDKEIGMPCKFDVIYDGTMNKTKNYLPLIGLLKQLGYKVFIVYIDNIPYSTIKKRALERYRKGGANKGRFVPMEVIDEYFEAGKSALNELKSRVDGYMVIDGNDKNYKIMERGGMELPVDRDYSVIGQPIPAAPVFDAGFISKRIASLKLSIKLKTAKDIAFTQKRIKGLELQLKLKAGKEMAKPAATKNGDVVIKKWYTKEYPTDELGEQLDDNNTFKDMWDAIHKGADVYDVLGVGDSMVRERVFGELAEINGVDYDYVYKKWLASDEFKENIDEIVAAQYKKLSANMATGGAIGKYSILRELLQLRNKGITQISLNGFNEDINYVVGLNLDDSEIKKAGEMSYITTYAKGGVIGYSKANKGLKGKFIWIERQNGWTSNTYSQESFEEVFKEFKNNPQYRLDIDEPKSKLFRRISDGRRIEFALTEIYEDGGKVGDKLKSIHAGSFVAYDKQGRRASYFVDSKGCGQMYTVTRHTGSVEMPFTLDVGMNWQKDIESHFDRVEIIMEDGGNIETHILNKGEVFDREKYKGVFTDFDKDGVANLDDPNPLRKGDKTTVEERELTNVFQKLLDTKNRLDDTMYDAVVDIKNISPKGSVVYARTKTPYSIINKLIEKRLVVPKDPKKGLTDVIGTTIAVDSYKDLLEVRDKIEAGKLYDVFEVEDFYENPNDGYRAVHYLLMYKGKTGQFPVELQLKTKRMKSINELSHAAYAAKNLDAARLNFITDIANKADNGDKNAIAEYNKIISDKDSLKKSFFLNKKMEQGGEIDEDWRELDNDFYEAFNKKKQKKHGGNVGEPYDSMTKYQLEKTLKKYNDEISAMYKKYGNYEAEEIAEKQAEADKIITLLYGNNFSGVGQKYKYATGGLVNKNQQTGGNEYIVYFKVDGRLTSKRVSEHSKSSAEAWVKNQYPTAVIKNTVALYKEGGEVDEEDEYDEENDLFATPENIPSEIQAILDKYEEEYLDGATYDLNERVLAELKPLGYTFDYYLDAEPYNLRKIEQMTKGGGIRTGINKKYTHFAISKKTGKIVEGWETIDDVESLKHFAKFDLKDNFPDNKPSDFTILSKQALIRRGINPFDWDSWRKTGEELAKGGKIGFERLASKVAKAYEGNPVAKKYQKQYGKTYSKSEAEEVGRKVAGKVKKLKGL
jgi:predicted kinase